MGNKLRVKKGQEEMVGFALIVIIVAVILLVFLGFSLRKGQKETIESYEAESFIQSFLQYTTEECRTAMGYLSVKELIFECSNEKECVNGKDSCEVLNSTLKGILDESWKIGEESPVKGYELKIISDEEEMLIIQEGKVTGDSKGASQDFVRSGNSFEILFIAYY